jgi:hypothetical protein
MSPSVRNGKFDDANEESGRTGKVVERLDLTGQESAANRPGVHVRLFVRIIVVTHE